MIAINSIELRRRGREGSLSCCYYPCAFLTHTQCILGLLERSAWSPFESTLAWRYGGPPTSWTSFSKLQSNSHPSFLLGLLSQGLAQCHLFKLRCVLARCSWQDCHPFWSCTCIFHSSFLLKHLGDELFPGMGISTGRSVVCKMSTCQVALRHCFRALRWKKLKWMAEQAYSFYVRIVCAVNATS